ncbi:ABC transporter substrate-binding protein [Tenggerimyces flavus]|uniref:Probable sugar-binding periplasmic protein n=1 Tax=Tenggerimyces flavus TaxID=1708749 RepID=A0ABV7YLV3_9ACTN|nr:ABC transporter substrate-binding protein [Tenggerimyces flavus]MBM7787744.1 glucose/mannose transport system substrate-binding protein [Tenggerimyces flavus]
MSKRLIGAVAAIGLLAVAGCGNGGDTNGSGSGDSGGGKSEVEVFSWWTGGGEAKGLEAMVKDFGKKQPDIAFKNAAVAGGSGTNAKAILESRLQSNDPPDSFQGHAGAELQDYIKAGRLEDLNSFYDEQGLRDTFPEQLVEQITFEGKIYSVPVNIHRSNVLWYNPAVLTEAGITAPATTVEEFITQLKTIKEKTGKIPISLGAQWTADHLLESVLLGDLGTDGYNALWAKGGDWASADVTKALDHFKQIVEMANTEAASTDWQAAAKNVVDGKAAYVIMGDWADGYFRELGKKPDVDYRWAASPGTDGTYMWLSDSFTLPKGAPHKDAAIEWLKECASKEGQDLFNPAKGSIPARKDADVSLYKDYLAWALEEWKSNDLAGSFWHGVTANNKWHTDIDTAVGLFLQSKDVGKFQTSLVDAAKNGGQV